MAVPMSEAAVADFGRDLVAVIAPTELPMFDVVSRSFFAAGGRLPPRRADDDALSFGVGEAVTLLTPIALATSAKVVSFLAEEIGRTVAKVAAEQVADRLRQIVRGEADAATLTSEQRARAAAIAFEAARDLGLPEDTAKLLAEAVAAKLAPARSA